MTFSEKLNFKPICASHWQKFLKDNNNNKKDINESNPKPVSIKTETLLGPLENNQVTLILDSCPLSVSDVKKLLTWKINGVAKFLDDTNYVT